MSKYEVIEQRVILEQPWAKIIVDILEHKGVRRPYYYLISPVESVATVGLTTDKKIILNYQYRHPMNSERTSISKRISSAYRVSWNSHPTCNFTSLG